MSFSSKLSPKLRKAMIQKPRETLVRALAEVEPNVDEEVLKRDLAAIGAQICTWSREARVLTLDIPAGKLSELNSVKGVLYVEADEQYRR